MQPQTIANTGESSFKAKMFIIENKLPKNIKPIFLRIHSLKKKEAEINLPHITKRKLQDLRISCRGV